MLVNFGLSKINKTTKGNSFQPLKNVNKISNGNVAHKFYHFYQNVMHGNNLEVNLKVNEIIDESLDMSTETSSWKFSFKDNKIIFYFWFVSFKIFPTYKTYSYVVIKALLFDIFRCWLKVVLRSKVFSLEKKHKILLIFFQHKKSETNTKIKEKQWETIVWLSK